ncbi:GntR family transcriptional regulator [Prolixibacter denitrificans]|uniref:Transcriptional regulator n=1 Tax=Prolixibacter denitrificans TaxID=1541063 RepID=A0A2P8C9L9_9BACT|nr:GntR family transcriptional regulator [Prolixibacter denitrificans]PSK81660.1 GntR family transcriptional regulator [Prolixibacter denitrificans]GET21184.1 transcriptional regulator [Prolixibacter denitrificans]
MKLKIDHNSSTPLHSQAEKLLRELINREEYQKGKLLPSEVELSKQLNISRNTLRHSINKLVTEGLLIRRKGYGTKVATRGISGRAKNWLSFTQEMKAMGLVAHNFELHLSWQVPEEEVLSFFDLKPESRLLSLERLRGKEDFPFVYFISYFNPEIGLTGNEDFSRPLYEMLEETYHVKASLSYEEISAIKATPFLCKKLDLTVGEPVLFRKRFVFDENKRPIEYNYGYYRGDSFVYTVESERKK